MKRMKLFSGTPGLVTKVDPVQLVFNESGFQELAVAYNIDYDDRGRPGRRKGTTLVLAKEIDHMWCDGGACLFTSGDALCILHPDYSWTPIRNVSSGSRVNACQVNDRAYYTTGAQMGYVAEDLSWPWEMGEYKGPKTLRHLTGPPLGHLVEHFRGRVYVAQGRHVYASELLYFGAFDMRRGKLPFMSDIRMMRAVDDGMYISDDHGVYFLAGKTLNSLDRDRVSDAPAYARTDEKTRGQLIVGQSGDYSIVNGENPLLLWTSEEGVMCGENGGRVTNLTKDKIEMPSGISGSGLVFNDKYVGLIDP